jgi:transposase
MEACATAHQWARELTKLGHDTRLMPPIYVKAYVKRGKNDAADAAAICDAAPGAGSASPPANAAD